MNWLALKFPHTRDMAKTPKKAPDIKALQAEIKFLKAENKLMDEAITAIQTRHSRKLLYDWLTLSDAKQIGVNIETIIAYTCGDITKTEMTKTIKHVGGR